MESKERQNALYSIGAFAKLTGVTERTLRYYDRQGLLKPSERNAQGHRYYSETDLVQLQRILTLKYLDFSLEDIAAHMSEEEQDFKKILANQYALLQKKHQQLERVMKTIERMQKLHENIDKIDRNLLLIFIHHIQHEEMQRELLSEHLSEAAVEALFMLKVSEEERLEAEKQLTSLLVRLLDLQKQGKHPLDEEAVSIGYEFLALTNSTLKEVFESLTDEEVEKFIALEENEMLDPIIFPNNFTKEERDFIDQLMQHISNEVEKGDN